VIEAANSLPGTLLIDTLDVIDDVRAVELRLDNLEIEVLIVIDRGDLLLLEGDLVEVNLTRFELFLSILLLVLSILVFHFLCESPFNE